MGDRSPVVRSFINRRSFLLGIPAVALASCSLEAGHNVVRIPVREEGLIGTLFLPRDPTSRPAVITLTGAGGGLWEDPARALAEAGFAALALATSNFVGLPPSVREIPIENVEKGIEWLRRRAAPKNQFVALRGWSRGAELSLILGSLTPSVNAALAYAPRCYVGLESQKQNNFGDPTAAPAWLYRGQPVVGLPLARERFMDPARPSLEDLHGIPVERIKGPILFVSGEVDTGVAGTMSSISCKSAMRRLRQCEFPYHYEHLSYPDAGHNIAGPPPFHEAPLAGGTVAGDIAAVADSWKRSLIFLDEAAKT